MEAPDALVIIVLAFYVANSVIASLNYNFSTKMWCKDFNKVISKRLFKKMNIQPFNEKFQKSKDL